MRLDADRKTKLSKLNQVQGGKLIMGISISVVTYQNLQKPQREPVNFWQAIIKTYKRA